MKKHKQYLLLYLSLFPVLTITAQERPLANTAIAMQGSQYQHAIEKKLSQFSERLSKSTAKFQKKISRNKKRLKHTTDSIVDSVFTLTDSVQQKTNGSIVYLPYLDTLENSLAFLEKIGGTGNQLNLSAIKRNKELIEEVKNKMTRMEMLGKNLQQQRQLLLQIGDRYKKQVRNYIQSISKECYYLGEIVNNYKQLLSDPSKIEEKLLALLRELPAFQRFLKEHSAIAGLFQLPSGNPGSLAGLQTRNMVQALLVERTSFASINASGMIANQMQLAKEKMHELKQQITASGEGVASDLPDFKPKEVKSKTFLQRMEFGSSLKFSQRNNSLPVRTETMLSVGYKFSDKMSLGVGVTHWLGLGNLQRIAFSHQGIGLTSYYKMQLKRSFFMSGGFEQHYFNQFQRLSAIKDGWKSSALMGIGKTIRAGKSLLGNKWGKGRKTSSNVTLLYDFLYKQTLPQTEALKLRFGFTF